METAVTAAAWIMAAVLGWAGQAKLRRSAGTRTALRRAGLPDAAWMVRLLGAGELGVSAAVLSVGGRVPAVLLVVVYAAFTAFAVVARRRPAASCGCFGDDQAPLSGVHVVVDGAGTVAAAGAALVAAPGVPAMLTGGPLVLAAAGIAVAAGLVTLLLTALPALTAALRTDAPVTGRTGVAAEAAVEVRA